jgi:hypothetical protein
MGTSKVLDQFQATGLQRDRQEVLQTSKKGEKSGGELQKVLDQLQAAGIQ